LNIFVFFVDKLIFLELSTLSSTKLQRHNTQGTTQ
jgi:hypothetical protein